MPIESGCPDGFQYMHPVMLKNFGQWDHHTHPRVGVLCHVAKRGDRIWTVRAGTQRILDVFTLRKLCEIGDEFADGYVRFTIRSNMEFMVSDEAKVELQEVIEFLKNPGKFRKLGGKIPKGVLLVGSPGTPLGSAPGQCTRGTGETSG